MMTAMAKLLFNLRNVPDDEAAEVRALLDEQQLDWYETQPGAFGISAAGLWLREEAQWPRARQALDAYQAQRQQRAREQARNQPSPRFADLLREQPGPVIGRLLLMAAIIAGTLALPWWLLR
jgi:non-ribosomal peptide synthetase component F